MQLSYLQAVELLGEHQHSVKELKKDRNRFTSKARTLMFSQIRPSVGGVQVNRHVCSNAPCGAM